jgi:hypothetical protein
MLHALGFILIGVGLGIAGTTAVAWWFVKQLPVFLPW